VYVHVLCLCAQVHRPSAPLFFLLVSDHEHRPFSPIPSDTTPTTSSLSHLTTTLFPGVHWTWRVHAISPIRIDFQYRIICRDFIHADVSRTSVVRETKKQTSPAPLLHTCKLHFVGETERERERRGEGCSGS